MNSAPIDTSVGDSAGHATRVTDLGSGNIKKVTVSDPQRHGSGVNSYVVSPAHRTAGCHLLSQLCLLVSSSVSPPAAAAAAAGRTHKYARTRFLALAFTTTSHLFSPHPPTPPHAKKSYKIITETDNKDFDQSRFTVIKRYSDFDWLRRHLVQANPGVIVPPLPEKSMIKKTESAFVETRRRALQTFLNRVASHEMLSRDETFRRFLQDTADMFAVHRLALEEALEAKSGGFANKFFSSATNAFRSVGRSTGITVTERPKTDDDMLFDEVVSYVNGLTPQLANVQKHTSNMVLSGKELSSALFEFGEAFKVLGNAEDKAKASNSLARALAAVGSTADGISATTAETAQRINVRFLEQVKDYGRMLAAVEGAIAQRREAQLAFWEAEDELGRKEAYHNKVAGQPGKEAKAAKARGEWETAQEKSEAARRHFQRVSETFFQEVAKFKGQKVQDFRAMLLDFIQLQIDHSKKVEGEWMRVIPDLESIVNKGGGVAGVGGAPSKE
jgi:sorting nexin-1/2